MGVLKYPRRRRRWTRSSGYVRFLPLWAAAVLAGTAYGAGWIGGPKVVSPGLGFTSGFSHPSTGSGQVFGNCYTGGGRNCVVDGDTFWMDGVKIRIADIDAPETHPPRCAREKELGFAATQRLRELLNSGRVTVSSIDRDTDRYGRKLRNVQVNGSDVGSVLVGEGLARWYAGGRRPWC